MYGLTLEQAPPYNVPLIYYIVGLFYLLSMCVVAVFYGLHVRDSLDPSAIILTHLMTLGFFTHVMIGTLFQMVPVIIAEVYTNVRLYSKVLLFTLNLGIFGFGTSTLLSIDFMTILAAFFIFSSLLFFSLYSLQTVARTKEKNPFVKTMLSALTFLFIGTISGAGSFLQYKGLIGGVWLGELHIKIMIFGWVFLLFCSVAYKILSMFYVAKEYPLLIKNYLYIIVSALLILEILSTFYELENIKLVTNMVLAGVITIFAFVTLKILKQRKRARLDITVNFFYFAAINLLVGSVVWVAAFLFDFKLDIVLGIVFSLGFIYGIINGMLYKIVPFLTWFHLSSSFVYEAEMGEVIEHKKMKIQFYLFLAAYLLFLLSSLIHQFTIVAVILFFCSSLLLALNLIGGYLY